MTERVPPEGSDQRTAHRRRPRFAGAPQRDGGTIPNIPPVYLSVEPEPTLLGFPAEFPPVDAGQPSEAAPAIAPPAPSLAVVKRDDPIAAGTLVLAGAAAGASVLLSWTPGGGPTGLSLLEQGAEALRSSIEAAQRAVWQPSVVVVCGGLLVLLGLLLLIPARTHRLVGVLALIVALAAAAAVVLLISGNALADDRFGAGLWCAVAVPVLGVLGSLKAMLTAPHVRLSPR
jgi:hypothetical protein